MKKPISVVMIGGALLLAGCSNIKSNISFDTFATEIKSNLSYSQVKVSDTSSTVKKVYTSGGTGFQSSIVIAKQTIQSGDSISFANENLKTLRQDIQKNGEITDSETINLECGDKEIPASISSIEVKKGDKTRYITQLYFVNNTDGYTISHLTEDKSEFKAAKKGLSNIECPSK